MREELKAKIIEDVADVETGELISCIIDNTYIEDARIQRQGRFGTLIPYICQNHRDGSSCMDKFEFRFSWVLERNYPYSSFDSSGVRIAKHGTTLEEFREIALEGEKHKREQMKKELEERKENFIENVLNYVNNNESDPLIFSNDVTINGDINIERFLIAGYGSSTISQFLNYLESLVDPIDVLVYRVILLTRAYNSRNKEREFEETDRGRRRSSLDIWRHIISEHTEITIFDVLSSLYKIGTDVRNSRFSGDYCYDVKRMVFHMDGTRFNGYSVESYKDEYNGLPELWKDAKDLYKNYLEKEKHEPNI